MREDKFRLSELEKLIPSIYEDNVLGKIPEDVCVNLLYGHLKGFAKDIKDSAKISRKQVIGYMGSTGNSSGPHLHFELYNPNNYGKVISPWTTYYQGKVSVTIGGNSYKANISYESDSYAQSWCNWQPSFSFSNNAHSALYRHGYRSAISDRFCIFSRNSVRNRQLAQHICERYFPK